MQPLNTIVSPRSESVIGCFAWVDGSMIASRRWPRATDPDAQMPLSSGPRRRTAFVIFVTAITSASAPSQRISPAMPHMSRSSGDDAQLVQGRVGRALDQHAFVDARLQEVHDRLRHALARDEHRNA